MAHRSDINDPNVAVFDLEKKEEHQAADKENHSHHSYVLTRHRGHKTPVGSVRFAAPQRGDISISHYQHCPDYHQNQPYDHYCTTPVR